MTKNNFGKRAFTFVELIVVVSIIAILGLFSIGSFVDFYKTREFSAKINNLENIIKNQDFKINNKDIFDYEIFFKKGEKYFLTYENNNFSGNKIFLDETKLKNEEKISLRKNKIFDKKTETDENIFQNYKNDLIEKKDKEIEKIQEEIKKEKSLKRKEFLQEEKIKLETEKQNLTQSLNNKKFFEIFFYKNGRFDEKIEKNLDEIENFEKNFDGKTEIKTKIFDSENLNNITIDKYDFEEEIILKEISDSIQKINKFNSLKIENIFGRKKVYLDGNLSKKVYLFFEDKNGKEYYFLIKN